MKISDLLSSTDVTADFVAIDKQQLLQELARKAGLIVEVLPDRILTELTKREEFGSTGMGGGVAIPHARFHQINKPFGLLVRLREPIDFDAVDGKPVDIVFLLLLPDTQVIEGQLSRHSRTRCPASRRPPCVRSFHPIGFTRG
jgi:nitrogen PTS system EIIA component